jgi:2,3-bisphosphoglycerate-dependent phosphoglycerate mutase
MESFVGEWLRTSFIENGAIVENSKTLWLQSSSGLFVDIRPLSLKSFAGFASIDSTSSIFTWSRKIDWRGKTPLDIGKVHFQEDNPNILIENSYLPEDNFTEIWQREDENIETDLSLALDVLPTGKFEFSAELSHTQTQNRWGCIVAVGSRFAIALGRESKNDDDEISSYFSSSLSSSTGASAAVEERVNEYICVFGNLFVDDQGEESSTLSTILPLPRSSITFTSPRVDPPAKWVITEATNPKYIGLDIRKALPQLQEWRIEKILSGLIPSALAMLFAKPRLMSPTSLHLLSDSVSPITTHVLVVRHGETSWNVQALLQGQLDVPLNLCGHNQAHAAGALIRDMVSTLSSSFSSSTSIPIGIISSDLRRPYATAVAISNALCQTNLPFPDSRFRETNLGSWQGRTWDDVENTRGDREEAKKWRHNPDQLAGNGQGESVRMRFYRVINALYDAALVYSGGIVIIVAHGGVIDDIGRVVKGLPFGENIGLRKHNCSVAHLTFTTKIRLERLGEERLIDAEKIRLGCGKVLYQETIEPFESSKVLGKWEIIEWGIIKHLEKHTAREDPLADSSKWVK